jgi:hypothetical protein
MEAIKVPKEQVEHHVTSLEQPNHMRNNHA